MNKFPSSLIIFLAIFALAAAVRFYKLDTIPIGFNDDEAAFGYNAYSILKTGRDEWGRFLPFPAFQSFGDWKLILYLYATIPSVAVFGLNTFATRFPSVIFGLFAIIACYLLSFELSKNRKIAAIASLLLAISPWHIVASRNAFESDVAIPFITFGTYFFIKGLKSKKFLTLSIASFFVCFYIYRSNWVFIPMYIAALSFLFKNQIDNLQKYFFKICIFALFLIPLLPAVFTFKGQSRFFQESFIWGPPNIGIIADINEKRGVCTKTLPEAPCKILYNKYFSFIEKFTNNYFDNLSTKTFFDKIQPTGFQSYATRTPFHLFELPLILTGLIWLFKKDTKALKVLLAWILLVPLGASTVGWGNYGRINIFMPAPQIVAAYGLFAIIKFASQYKLIKATLIVVITTVTMSTVQQINDLLYQEPFKISRYQRYGYQQLFDYLKGVKNDYDQVYISRKIDSSHQYIQFLFWNKVDPAFFQNNNVTDYESSGWVSVRSVGSYNFVPSITAKTLPDKTAVVASEHELTTQVAPNYIIKDIRGDIIFEIFDGDKIKQEASLKTDE